MKQILLFLLLTTAISAEYITLNLTGTSMMPFIKDNGTFDTTYPASQIKIGDVVRTCPSKEINNYSGFGNFVCVAHAVIWRNATHYNTKGINVSWKDYYSYADGSQYFPSFETDYRDKMVLSLEVDFAVKQNTYAYIENKEKGWVLTNIMDFLRSVGRFTISTFKSLLAFCQNLF